MGHKIYKWIIRILMIIYIINPFDIIPDYIPLLGWIDDGIVLYLLISDKFRKIKDNSISSRSQDSSVIDYEGEVKVIKIEDK
jgi:uncharacterized membrane protein YkvA (DUF1232 family)